MTLQADMNWFAVLAHHAGRTPDKPLCVFGDETVTYGEMAAPVGGAGRRAARPRRRRRRRRGAPVLQLQRVPGDDLRRQPPRARSPCRSTGGSPRPRSATSSSTPRRGRWCATDRWSSWPTRRRRGCEAPRSGRACRARADGLDAACRAAAGAPTRSRRRRGGGRRPPADVHVGHDRAAQGRDAHPRQPGVEEPGPHRRVRRHRRRPRPGLRSALPRRRARPHDHHADRGGGLDDPPSPVRRGRRGRRDRAVAGHHRVAGAGDGQRDHGAARRRRSATSRRCGW